MIYLNLQPLNVTLFPDNTSQVWKLPKEILNSNTVEIDWEFNNEGEFMQLAQLKQLLDHHSINTHLTLKYLPYGRQDKEVSNSTTFALRTFANLLNSLDFDHIAINDPHSEIALTLINNSYAYYPTKNIENIIKLTESDIVCYPDKGALTKYSQVYDFPNIYGEKLRDQITGNITNYKLVGNPKDCKILIVDDICDGGMTFILLSKQLMEAGAKEVNLFVSHGIFSKGIKILKEAGIKRVFTTDGEVDETHNGFTYRRI